MSSNQCVSRYSSRVDNLRPSCVREMMSKINGSSVISFAAGLPDPALFPVAAISQAASAVLVSDAASALQYASTEGYPRLREYIARELLGKKGIEATPAEIIITNGSQQALDLLGKVFIDKNSEIIMEEPTYMAAIQAFDLYQPTYLTVPLRENGIDTALLEKAAASGRVRLMYGVTNFQNPTGISYSWSIRQKVADILDRYDITLIEDNPYSELRYEGEELPLISQLRNGNSIIIGTFSKILSPGLRMGWLYAQGETMRKLILAKQAADLCSNYFSQYILYHYLKNNNLDAHIDALRNHYRQRRDHMLSLLSAFMPDGTSWTYPAGGMFIWLTLPETVSATALLEQTIDAGVIFAPGESFFASSSQHNTMRLNFTHSDSANMTRGIKILAEEIAKVC